MALGDFGKVATVLILMGFFLDALVLSRFTALAGADGAVEGLQIAAFLAYMAAVLLALLAYYGAGDPLRANRTAAIFTVVFCFIAVVFIVVSLIVCGSRTAAGACGDSLTAYPTTLLTASAALAFIGGVLAVVNLARKY